MNRTGSARTFSSADTRLPISHWGRWRRRHGWGFESSSPSLSLCIILPGWNSKSERTTKRKKERWKACYELISCICYVQNFLVVPLGCVRLHIEMFFLGFPVSEGFFFFYCQLVTAIQWKDSRLSMAEIIKILWIPFCFCCTKSSNNVCLVYDELGMLFCTMVSLVYGMLVLPPVQVFRFLKVKCWRNMPGGGMGFMQVYFTLSGVNFEQGFSDQRGYMPCC